MAITVRIGLFACLWNLGSQAVAEENLFTSPKGYSLRYPTGWRLITPVTMDGLPESVQTPLKEQSLDLHNVDAAIVKVTNVVGFAPNLSIAMSDSRLPLEEATLTELRVQLHERYHLPENEFNIVAASVRPVGINKAIILDYELKHLKEAPTLRHLHCFIPCRGQTLTVACTAPAEDFDRYAPQFEAILSTIKLEGPIKGIGDDNQSPVPHNAKDQAQGSRSRALPSRFGGSIHERLSFASPKGYSFRYPPNWTLITEATIGDLPKDLRERFAGERAGREKFDSALLVEVNDGIATNVTVGVLDVPLPIDESALAEVGDEILKQNQSFGFEIHRPTRKIAKVGANLAMIFDYSTKHWAVALTMRHRQYLVRSGMETLIVTCISREEDFDQHAPEFEALMASFKLAPPPHVPETSSPSPAPAPSDRSDATFIYCVLGAMLLFGTIGILKICRRSTQRATRDP